MFTNQENVASVSESSFELLKTIFVDGGDLILVLEGLLTLTQMLDCKIKAAQTRGLIYVDAITGKAKK